MVGKIEEVGGRKKKIDTKLKRKDCVGKASCTGEGINYVIECRTCREGS